MVGAVLAGSWEPAFFMAGFWESAFFMAGFWESVLLGPAFWSRLSRILFGGGFWGWVAFWESAMGIAGRGKAALRFVCLKA